MIFLVGWLHSSERKFLLCGEIWSPPQSFTHMEAIPRYLLLSESCNKVYDFEWGLKLCVYFLIFWSEMQQGFSGSWLPNLPSSPAAQSIYDLVIEDINKTILDRLFILPYFSFLSKRFEHFWVKMACKIYFSWSWVAAQDCGKIKTVL